ncbi:hypothetical protein XCR1_2410008 [Xenorhabdus cabanillasii JM26]|uniref:Uncharacterized protein n=1 Tax=Xenorhabdus cabanillasii JM26 TaxID=1427517 RepID=W1J7H0_9GAMM|nr:hypothetical protein XCR1_2410008 [Xenorhabdus cabanillasii JM26]
MAAGFKIESEELFSGDNRDITVDIIVIDLISIQTWTSNRPPSEISKVIIVFYLYLFDYKGYGNFHHF